MNRKQLYTYIKEKGCEKDLLCKLAEYVENVSPNKFCDIKPALSTFIHQYKRKMTTFKREYSKFKVKYTTWLDGTASFKLIENANPLKNVGARPEVPFDESSTRSRDRKVCKVMDLVLY